MRRVLWLTGGLIAAGVLLVAVPNAVVLIGAGAAGHDPATAPHAQVALVLGASVFDDGTPTDVLADRLAAGAALYRDGRVTRVLVSGERATAAYDQVDVMRRELVRMGVPDREIFTDHGGFDTWDSMVRARKIYDVRSAVVVTQHWHMPRALWLGKRAGLKVHGLVADRIRAGEHEPTVAKWATSEVLARVKAVIDVVADRQPPYLGPKIPITGSAEASRPYPRSLSPFGS
ncbi:MAG TPA: ElyC/SanA/YdcF family protein [Solirubrobacteraceae bacterium]